MPFQIMEHKCNKCGCTKAEIIPTEYGTALMCTECMEVEKLDDVKSFSSVVCPYCHSKNTKKISTVAKVTNTVMFGIFGTKRHKQWHCNNCKSDF